MADQLVFGDGPGCGWPRLSETLTHPRRPDACQSCGNQDRALLQLWIEHDDFDKPTSTLVCLCLSCSGRIVEPHPRLYDTAPRNAPLPGAMALCTACRHRDGLTCKHPDLGANGGPGISIRYSQPSVMFVDGTRRRRRSGWQVKVYAEPPSACAGREVAEEGPNDVH